MHQASLVLFVMKPSVENMRILTSVLRAFSRRARRRGTRERFSMKIAAQAAQRLIFPWLSEKSLGAKEFCFVRVVISQAAMSVRCFTEMAGEVLRKTRTLRSREFAGNASVMRPGCDNSFVCLSTFEQG